MSLICYLCYKQLFAPNFPIYITNYARLNSKKVILKNQQNTENLQPNPKIQEFPKKVFVTSCGHLFHKDCLSEHCNIVPEVPCRKKIPKICPICGASFCFINCIAVNAESQIKTKMIESRQKLEEITSKTQALQSKLMNLRIKLKKREDKYAKILKLIEELQDSSLQIVQVESKPDKLLLLKEKPELKECQEKILQEHSAQENEPFVIGDSSNQLLRANEIRKKLLNLLKISKSMEKEMKEFNTSLTNRRLSMELDAYRSNSRDYFKSSRCEIATQRLLSSTKSENFPNFLKLSQINKIPNRSTNPTAQQHKNLPSICSVFTKQIKRKSSNISTISSPSSEVPSGLFLVRKSSSSSIISSIISTSQINSESEPATRQQILEDCLSQNTSQWSMIPICSSSSRLDFE